MTDRTVAFTHDTIPMRGDEQVDCRRVVLPPGNWELFDPFLLFAEDWFSTSGFDWHPHRGIETVTVVLDGALEHGDSHGNAGVLAPGDVQWMTAGRGIIHRELAHRNDNVHTLQLWVNLPRVVKLTDTAYQDLRADRLAIVERPGARIDVISGAFDDVAGPATNHQPITALSLAIDPGTTVDVPLPADQRAFVYVLEGRARIGADADPVAAGEVAWSQPTGEAGAPSALRIETVDGDTPLRAMLFAGAPLREPVATGGPFVMNTPDEIEQSFADYRAGRFGPIPRLARVQ